MEPENPTTEEAMSNEDLNEENSTTNIITQQAEPGDYTVTKSLCVQNYRFCPCA